MIAVLKGDIIGSRSVTNQEIWLEPLKGVLCQWGDTPKQWELIWGDFFQLEITNPEEALQKALFIKTVIKKTGKVDVRMSIGIGHKTYQGEQISESNGPAFIYAGERFEQLKKDKVNLAVKSPWSYFDEEINLYLKLAGYIMDNWTVSSAEIMQIAMRNSEVTQEEIGQQLGIAQSSVSNRWQRARVDTILEIEQLFRKKIKQYNRL